MELIDTHAINRFRSLLYPRIMHQYYVTPEVTTSYLQVQEIYRGGGTHHWLKTKEASREEREGFKWNS